MEYVVVNISERLQKARFYPALARAFFPRFNIGYISTHPNAKHSKIYAAIVIRPDITTAASGGANEKIPKRERLSVAAGKIISAAIAAFCMVLRRSSVFLYIQ